LVLGLGQKGMSGFDPYIKEINFTPTIALTAIIPAGDQSNVLMTFADNDQRTIRILVGPLLCAQLHAAITDTLAAMPTPPNAYPLLKDMFGLGVPGHPHSGGDTETFFGDTYDTKILKSFGLLMVRANLVERSLIRLLHALSGMPLGKAESLFYSTVAGKARIDMIRALIAPSLPEVENAPLKEDALEALDRAGKVMSRRNALVHGHWAFKGNHFEVTSFQPNLKHPYTTFTATAKSIMELATDYRSVGMLIEMAANSLLQRNIAANTSGSASSGGPIS